MNTVDKPYWKYLNAIERFFKNWFDHLRRHSVKWKPYLRRKWVNKQVNSKREGKTHNSVKAHIRYRYVSLSLWLEYIIKMQAYTSDK